MIMLIITTIILFHPDAAEVQLIETGSSCCKAAQTPLTGRSDAWCKSPGCEGDRNGEGPLKKPPLPLHHCKAGAGSFCPELSGVGAGKNEVKIDFSLQPE